MTLKTSDLAICAEVSHCAVREYSDQGLLGPVERSQGNSYRFFDLRMIPQIHLIKSLREMGYTPQDVKDYGKNRTPETVAAALRSNSARLAGEIAALQAKKDVLETYISLIEEGQAARPGIELRTLPEQRIHCSAMGNLEGTTKTKNIERLRRAYGKIRQEGNAGCPLGYAYESFFDLLERPDQPTQLISYDPQGSTVRPAGEYMVGTVACYYGEKNSLPQRMFKQALAGDLELFGPAYMVHLHDAACVTSPEQYLLQIAVQVKKTEELLS